MSIFTKVIHGLGVAGKAIGHFLGHLFAADVIPIAIDITEEINQAIQSGSAQTLVNVLDSIDPQIGAIGQDIVNEAKVLGPKVLATELGLQALETGATAESAVAWGEGVIQAYGSADLLTKTKTLNAVATKLAVLFDQGRQTNKTWMDWAQTVQDAFDIIKQQAAADAAGTTE